MTSTELNRFARFSVILATLILLVEAALLGLYHEEPTRILVAVSMLTEGRWLVPDMLGHLYLNKPPGYNWIVALFSLPYGEVTKFSARLTAVASWLGLGGLVGWWAGKVRRSRTFHWVGASAVWFCVSIFMEKAALAEIDLFFSLVLFAALGVFFEYDRQDAPTRAWIYSHLLFALAVLTKGPVAHLFFYLPVGVFLILEGRLPSLRYLIVGVLTAHLIVVGWLFAVVNHVSLDGFLELVVQEVFKRGGEGEGITGYLNGLLKYPLVLFGSYLPWSLVLLAYIRRDVRDKLFGSAVDSRSRFMLSALTPLIVLWLFPANNLRYALPTFPWMATLVAFTYSRGVGEESFEVLVRRSWFFLGGVLALVGVVPFVLEPSVLISSTQQLLIGGTIGFTGLVLLVVTIIYDFNLRFLTGLFLFFTITLKVGYLALYVPSEKQEYLLNERRTYRQVETLSPYADRRLHFESGVNLEVPYYFHRAGFNVTIDPQGEFRSGAELIVTPDSLDDRDSFANVRFHEGPTFHVYPNP